MEAHRERQFTVTEQAGRQNNRAAKVKTVARPVLMQQLENGPGLKAAGRNVSENSQMCLSALLNLCHDLCWNHRDDKWWNNNVKCQSLLFWLSLQALMMLESAFRTTLVNSPWHLLNIDICHLHCFSFVCWSCRQCALRFGSRRVKYHCYAKMKHTFFSNCIA